MGTLRLLVADDHEIVRKGLCAILQQHPGWVVVAEAGDGWEAVKKAKAPKPDVVILDISMPLLNGLEATRHLQESALQTKVLILTMHESDSLILELFDAGARGYVLKTDAGTDLIKAVEAVSQNQRFFTAKVARMVLDGYLKPTKDKVTDTSGARVNRLTPRQREILLLLTEGQSSKEVAVTLGLSVKTAETHRANIMNRLDCHSASELVRYAVRNGFIQA